MTLAVLKTRTPASRRAGKRLKSSTIQGHLVNVVKKGETMRNLLVKTPLVAVFGVGLLLSGCATKEEAEHAQATADHAMSQAQAATSAAQHAQSTADVAASAAQA